MFTPTTFNQNNMPNTFVVSDVWFNRIFSDDKNLSVVDNNENIIDAWNSVVRKEDKVYVLGGLGICDLFHILIRLNGEIHILNNYFNSDEKTFMNELKDAIQRSSDVEIKEKFCFEDNQIVILNELDSVLSYLPLQDWPGKKTGTFCFHGLNTDIDLKEHNITCVAMQWDYKPMNISEIINNIASVSNKL